MKKVIKLTLLLFILNVVFVSCTVEDEILIDDSSEMTPVNIHKKDLDPPIEPND